MLKRQAKEKKYILDWNNYIAKAREAVSEGCVLVKNDNDVLPMAAGTLVSVFGRIQTHYYKSGVGSGGMVNVDTVTGILEGLENSGKIAINGELLEEYTAWERENPYDEGCGWGKEPWSQKEMPLSDETVIRASGKSQIALVIIGRTAGEDRDAGDVSGSYRLTETEEDMLAKVRMYFEKVIVVLNVGGIIDMTFIDKYSPDAVLIAWQGGMVGGDGVADVLTGVVSPSGKLTDTIAYNIEDYPAFGHFGDREKNYYVEDIYVGYRYFETFAKEKVRYPFGYGLSYTHFDISVDEYEVDATTSDMRILVRVENTGDVSGKEVVCIYVGAASGKLGRPSKELIAFGKTDTLAAGEVAHLEFHITGATFATFDDSGATGYKSCKVLEAGVYNIYVGNDVSRAGLAFSYELPELIVTERLSDAYAPTSEFKRIKPIDDIAGNNVYGNRRMGEEQVPLAAAKDTAYIENQSIDILPETKNDAITLKLSDVYLGNAGMNEFIMQMTDNDLTAIVSGEGMGSPLVTPGTASAFGGVSERLRNMGIPAVCTSDGPSGIRMDCGTKAFSLPIGIMLGCTFNVELVSELYSYTGMELAANRIECLLGPGMNIHRYPLNGRNFEYYSEDPLVTGAFAIAFLKGLKTWNVSGAMKHFCGNNQELGRRTADAVISERALRDIYLKGFEMAVKSGYADAIMTSYGMVNGIRTAECYDLCTTILRDEWGFNGIVMTDWWANISSEPEISPKNGFRLMVRSQNDIFMVNNDAADNDYTEVSLRLLCDDERYRAWLRRSAANICTFVMRSRAMSRLMNEAFDIEIINRAEEDNQDDIWNLEYIEVDGYLSYDLSYKESKKGTNYVMPTDTVKSGTYEVSLTGFSYADELAQIPCTLFATGTPVATFTFNGSNGEPVTIKKNIILYKRKCLNRLYVSANGVTLTNITFKFISDDISMTF